MLDLTDHPEVPQAAWSFANDAWVIPVASIVNNAEYIRSLLTPLLVLYPPQYIAVSAIYLACLTCNPQVALPLTPAPWWELFDVPTEEAVHDVLQMLLDMYTRWAGETDWVDRKELGRSLSDRQTVWKRAAHLKLPLAKEDVRRLLAKQPS